MKKLNNNSITFLSTDELADRWPVSRRTLEGWRLRHEGPGYIKLGSRVAYPIDEVVAYEQAHLFGAWRHES